MKNAKKYLDPKMDKSGRNDNVKKALELAHDEIKRAIEIAYLEGFIYTNVNDCNFIEYYGEQVTFSDAMKLIKNGSK